MSSLTTRSAAVTSHRGFSTHVSRSGLDSQPGSFDGELRCAQDLLSRRTGAPMTLCEPENLGGSGRSWVLRVRVGENPINMPKSLIIRKLRHAVGASAHSDAMEETAYRAEVAAYKFMTALPEFARPGPYLVASDSDEHVMVISDLGYGRTLAETLRSSETVDAERQIISAWGQALGRVHVGTVGRERDFLALGRRESLNRHASDPHDTPISDAARAVKSDLPNIIHKELSIVVPASVIGAVQRGADMFKTGTYRAFSAGNVGPSNAIVTADGVQFLDYEAAGFHDISLDIGYALATMMPYIAPNAPQEIRRVGSVLLEAWRTEVDVMWPALANTKTLRSMALTGMLLWTSLSTYWFFHPESRPRLGLDHVLVASNPVDVRAQWLAVAAVAEDDSFTDLHDVALAVARGIATKFRLDSSLGSARA